jgi:hypothetical protein
MSPLPVAKRLPVGAGATEITVPRRISKLISASTGDRLGLTRVLVALEHHLGVAGNGIPELDTAILRATHDPLAIGCQAHAEHKVLDPCQSSRH